MKHDKPEGRKSSVKDLYTGLKFAFSYFSILPVRLKTADNTSSAGALGAMLFFFPLVGMVLGLLVIGLFYLLSPLGWYAAVFSSVTYMILYGFLHTEAVMDVADAIYASHSGKDAYETIKKPDVGAMGVLWGIAVVFLKTSGITFLLLHHLFSLFLSVLIISRLALLMLFYTQTFRSTFLTQLKKAFSPIYFTTAFFLFTAGSLPAIGMHFILLLSFGLMIAWFITKTLQKKLGFINGDVLGTTLEGVEILLFVTGVLLWL